MTKTIRNLALPLVMEEIENVLDSYHYHPYQQAYATPDLRQQLIAYVLNNVPAFYAMVEEGSDIENFDPNLIPHSIRHQLREVVVEGIQYLSEKNADWICHHVPQDLNAGLAPSSWFG